MHEYLDVLYDVLGFGSVRETRTGKVVGLFDVNITHELPEGFPLLTTKKLKLSNIIGEALWFLSGSTNLDDLKHYSDLKEDAWTIWTNDAERWGGEGNADLGALYGNQWRNYNNQGVDQIQNVIKSIKEDPMSRYHIVNSWNPIVQRDNSAALMPCHVMFQLYIQDGVMDLKWVQRSVDCFLGLPYNIASYSFILMILAKLTGYEAGTLTGTFGDTHIYSNHINQVEEILSREPRALPDLVLPEFDTLDELLTFTAKDFKLYNYDPYPAIKAKLSVGE